MKLKLQRHKKQLPQATEQQGECYSFYDLPLKLFVDILQTSDVAKLVKSGTVEPAALSEKWEDIYYSYADNAPKDRNAREAKDLRLTIYELEVKDYLVNTLCALLELGGENDTIIESLSELGYEPFGWEPGTPIDIPEFVNYVRVSFSCEKFHIDRYREQLEDITSKQAKQNPNADIKMAFISHIVRINTAMQSRVSFDTVLLSEYVVLAGDYAAMMNARAMQQAIHTNQSNAE